MGASACCSNVIKDTSVMHSESFCCQSPFLAAFAAILTNVSRKVRRILTSHWTLCLFPITFIACLYESARSQMAYLWHKGSLAWSKNLRWEAWRSRFRAILPNEYFSIVRFKDRYITSLEIRMSHKNVQYSMWNSHFRGPLPFSGQNDSFHSRHSSGQSVSLAWVPV